MKSMEQASSDRARRTMELGVLDKIISLTGLDCVELLSIPLR